jgi:glycosyltransferase involved in cell wall biosynthesis
MSRRAPRLVSVVIPVRDAAGTLAQQLAAVAAQEYDGEWEIVVADGGSADGGLELARRWAAGVPRARVLDVSAHGAGPNRTRNAGAAAARGDFLAFCDADDVAAPGWLAALAAAAPGSDIVAGRLDVESLNPPAVRAWHRTPRWEREHPFRAYLPPASTANLGIWRDAFEAVGGFSADLPRAEDRDLAWRAQLAGSTVSRAPGAVIAYRYRPTPRATAAQHFAWGRAGPDVYRRFRAEGLARTRARDSARAWLWLALSAPALARSERLRGTWAVHAGLRAGQLVGSVRNRVVFL